MATLQVSVQSYQTILWEADSDLATFPFFENLEAAGIPRSVWSKDAEGNILYEGQFWAAAGTLFISAPYYGTVFPGWAASPATYSTATSLEDITGDGKQYFVVTP